MHSKVVIHFVSHFSQVLVQCFNSLFQPVTSQAENNTPLIKVYIVSITEYTLEISVFRIYRLI